MVTKLFGRAGETAHAQPAPPRRAWRDRRFFGRIGRVLALAAASCMVTASPASAAAWCQSKMSDMFVDQSGRVLVLPAFRGDWLAICSLDGSWNGVSPATCNGWMAEVTSALLTDKEVLLHYADPVSVCANVPPFYQAPSPVYVLLHK